MTNFAAAAPFYAAYRPGYPSAVFELIRDRFQLDGTQQLLDLGCGPGTLAIPLSRYVKVVHAVDPEPAMVAEGVRLAASEKAVGVAWRVAWAADLPVLGLPQIAVATLGRSLGWMDAAQVLSDLDDLVEPAGGVVFVGSSDTSTRPGWLDVIESVGAEYLGPDYRERHGPHHRGDDPELDLSASPFPRADTAVFDQPLTYGLDDLVGLQFSMSYTSPEILGTRTAAYERDLRAALRSYSPAGVFHHARRVVCTVAVRG
ncbi:methyltransferase domain-containing protein [Streptomyces sp. PCS3-D2]|uniref:class I SAM-dependent methyltransferase n=1 Tax=Streptomyces sp. PCS3-D2 TaxID=1460244 RepID=UPI000452EB23|nr:class I SAM-dependent methyltransferase [Streptomyces sp. PCS3-D2]WKV74176.1 methyltransferase domain-containing protein [Streptomyces sp. PCS3-D2]